MSVPALIAGIRAGRDEVLECAIECLKNARRQLQAGDGVHLPVEQPG